MTGLGTASWSVARAGRATLLVDLVLVALVAVHLGGGSAAGAGRDALGSRTVPNPVAYLGRSFDHSACASAPLAHADGSLVVCRDFTAVVGPDDRTLVVSMYGTGATTVREYRGRMPQGLTWGDTLAEVVEALGKPDRITDAWGPPTLVYMYDGRAYGSLELRFNGADRLASIHACLTR